jgi:hypothetical protein
VQEDYVNKAVAALIILFLVTLACGRGTPEVHEEVVWRCPPLPEAFEESDLVGIWHSRYDSESTDTITLREDGTYQQVYCQKDGYSYESPWNRWYLENRPSGGLYLHLEGMHYCLSTDEVCKREEGGGGDWSYYDRCEGRLIWTMDKEVILAVTGDKGFRYPGIESVPRGVILWHMRGDVDSADNFFILQE